MNFIAHLFLSGTDEGLIVGNFIADSVRGKDVLTFSEPIQKGIRLHRFIDTFTDTHPTVRQCKQLLQPTYSHYSSVLVDIFFDYFFVRNWHTFTAEPLADFAGRNLQVLIAHADVLPTTAKMFLDYNLMHNRIVHYGEEQTITKVLQGMSRRARFESNMHLATKELRLYQEAFNEAFLLFFPQLIAASQPYTTDEL